MSYQVQLISKLEVAVKVHLTSGEVIEGVFFAKQYERVSDILNDGRLFIPLRDTEGATHLLAKAHIQRVIPLSESDATAPKANVERYLG